MTPHLELQLMRTAMDAINHKLAAVLYDRARLCRAIGSWKRSKGIPAADPAREEAMLKSLLHKLPADGYSPEQMAAILGQVFAASRSLVENAD